MALQGSPMMHCQSYHGARMHKDGIPNNVPFNIHSLGHIRRSDLVITGFRPTA